MIEQRVNGRGRRGSIERYVRSVSICNDAGKDPRGNVHCVEDGEKVVRDPSRDATEVRVYLNVEIWDEESVEQPVSRACRSIMS